MDTPLLFLLPVAGLALLAASLLSAARTMRANPPRAGAEETAVEAPEEPPPPPRAIVVFNPSKFDKPETARQTLSTQAREHGWLLEFLETTVEDPGTGQAVAAMQAEPDLVIACGGDGTVRAVAEKLAGSGVRMGLVPTGTGNLLARNLDLPLDDLAAAMDIALAGADRDIDVGWLSLDGGENRAFLVMAGVGFDAEIMADAPEALKSKVGPAAYFVSGLRKLNGKRERVRVEIDDRVIIRRVRSVIIGNCGKLQAGIELMPDAEVDDGKLDVMLLSPKGVVGWAAVAGEVITHHHRGHPVTEIVQGQELSIATAGPLTAQLDGDPVGEMRQARAWVQPACLTMRVHGAGRLATGA